MKNLQEMTAEVVEVNTLLGWRATIGTPGEYVALLHTEIAEATGAWRKWRDEDATWGECERKQHHGQEGHPDHVCKPEGIGAELADALIRLMDTADVLRQRLPRNGANLAVLTSIEPLDVARPDGFLPAGFPEEMALLHRLIDRIWDDPSWMDVVLGQLVGVSSRFGIDLYWEWERKLAHNRTREFQHGGTL